ncbi:MULTISPECIES: prolyl oligopeptidase family serine peptidase [unclassified Wenzhouxiangella]|uniref:prolyl oligopeptidase family serine peptidase n=1 Tax=unclassified Wenzhouxiangella TaxID=2613841 RepID=UPI000E3290DB|nr:MULTISPECIES: prolyl oligopeptidase family serine peptidase [unclassified Wenzhouxiangella]RFF27143.1 S9 family peptidase [Wenzhouxiangella sp. 15181]RFP69171.1 S9 family peptidase [Wenzhouxiangella sp. 15190]
MIRYCLFALIIQLPFSLVLAEETATEPVAIDEVLALGALPVDVEMMDKAGHADDLRRALVGQVGEGALPRDGQSVTAFGKTWEWQPVSPDTLDSERALQLWWFQLETDRFVRGHLKVEDLRNAAVYVDGDKVDGGEEGHALDLRNGSHQVWIVHEGAAEEGEPALAWKGRSEQDWAVAHTRSERRVSAQRLTNAETVSDLAISPDGRYLALAHDRRDEAADADIRRLEIRDLQTDRIVRQWTAERPSALAWSPDGSKLALETGESLWLHDRESGRARALLLEHEGIGSWRWHPDSRSILFSWVKKDETDTDKRRRLRALEDRWAGFRDISQLYQVDVDSGIVRALTAEEHSVNLHDVVDGRVLLSHSVIDYAEPPHGLTRVFELDLEDGQRREIARLRRFNDIRYAEEGYWLLAGPGLAIGDGDTTAEDVTPNDYDTQLYHLSVDGTEAVSVSRDFDPAFSGIERLADGNLLLSAVSGEESVLVHFDRDADGPRIVDSGVAVMESFVASRTSPPTVVVRGSDADAPQRVHRVGLDGGNEVLVDSRETAYADVVLGEVRDWTFTNADDVEIDGRYYLPPDFDPEQQYPLIVYYYGGTMPVNRQFTGRYPFNLWAANGYVIYVVQPRGAIGYGQDFSAKHVNAWGEYAADDIIEGTRKFVEAHDFVDGERIGNIGASYGGFMTMYLATRTDLFAASISHAGISALTSYWGEGWWGYSYSGIASQGSFPWNSRELYVEQSPVYNADEITTPLLLLHGDSDTNVPPGESDNMFTALKLLGREVEMVEFPGEDHWILDREKRYVWWDSILAWYDKWLKDEPEWWQHLYPES